LDGTAADGLGVQRHAGAKKHAENRNSITLADVTTPFGWSFPYAWPRKPVLAANVVCTSQPVAAQAGLRMLAQGGSAVDAAVATAITLTVVEPVSNGIGSDAFAIVWDGKRLHGLNASGRSPAAWTPEYFGGNAVPALGWNSVTVPGAVSAWVELHAKFGKLPFEKLFEPAISYGRNGFLVSPTIAEQWTAQVPLLKEQPGFAEAFMPAGRAPKPGERFRFPSHAATLEKIAATNGEAFYRGELADKLHAHAAANGGAMRASDLAAHRADWVGTINSTYRGYTVHEIPPNGQGIVALIALGILERFDMASLPADSADGVHLQIEAVKLAFADAQAYVADIDHMPFSAERLLDKEYLKQRAALIDRSQAKPAAAGTPNGGTVYLTAADAAGMMVSMIQSNYLGFGSGVVVPGTGISLQNRGADFAAAQGHPNRVGPNKRPYHTIIPGFVTKDGNAVMSFGVMGGTMQPQGHVQVMVRIADHGQNPQAACDGPRFRWVHGTQISCERGFPQSTLDELRRRGHDLVAVEDYNQFGSCQAIWCLDGGYFAASDPRRDGQAAAF
jgi:gamma-glutamyltranspeptidase / glutathione hydrolase